jgi:hypothetical protein
MSNLENKELPKEQNDGDIITNAKTKTEKEDKKMSEIIDFAKKLTENEGDITENAENNGGNISTEEERLFIMLKSFDLFMEMKTLKEKIDAMAGEKGNIKEIKRLKKELQNKDYEYGMLRNEYDKRL